MGEARVRYIACTGASCALPLALPDHKLCPVFRSSIVQLSRKMSATGADLPPEILSQIIKHLDPMITSDMFKDKIRRLRQGLAACSLVC